MEVKDKIFTIHRINEKDPAKNELVLSIDKEKKTGEYFVNPKSSQYKWIKKIDLLGFEKLPAGLRKDGLGFTSGSSGYLIPSTLFEKFGEFGLTISTTSKNIIEKVGNKYKVSLNYFDLRPVLDTLKSIKQESYVLRQSAIGNFFNKQFPKHFDRVEEKSLIYQKNQFRNLLNKEGILENISNEDIKKLIDFLPEFIKFYGDKFRGDAKKLIGLTKNKKATEIIYLENIVKDFERRLGAKVQNENNWQKFFRNYILLFNSNYIAIFEKENLSLTGKYPDFLPIDVYGYLDIYEIKRPNTELMKLDKSHKNYYWSTEMAKAISQVENYIFSADKNSSALKEEMEKRENNMEINIVRPRGFVVAGTREQLKNKAMKDNFRLLNNALKNVEIILYDDLLLNLKNLLGRLKK
jgi:hypothetical protein